VAPVGNLLPSSLPLLTYRGWGRDCGGWPAPAQAACRLTVSVRLGLGAAGWGVRGGTADGVGGKKGLGAGGATG
jgi:hypothetical protein